MPATLGYAFTHGLDVWTPEGKATSIIQNINAHNAALEAAELERWSTAPATFVAYVVRTGTSGKELQTWTGKLLGYVSQYRVYRNNLGVRIASVRVRGTNGAEYYGRMSADWSQLIRLRKAKG